MSDVETKVKTATKDVCDLMDKVTRGFLNDFESMSVEEAYKVADIYKDLAEAKMYIVCAMEKEQIMDAMKESEYGVDYDEDGPMGYRGRSASTGRFVSRSGGGRPAGYIPKPYWNEPYYMDGYMDNYGYDNRRSTSTNGRTSEPMNYGYTENHTAGKGSAYDHYREARKNDDTAQMKHAINDMFDDLDSTIMDVWKDVDQGDKPKYKMKLQELIQKMK